MLTSVVGDRYAIGYVSLGSLNDSVKAVKEDLSPVAQDFINFIVSEDGQKVITANKYIKIQMQI